MVFSLTLAAMGGGRRGLSPHLPEHQHPQADRPMDPQTHETTLHRFADTHRPADPRTLDLKVPRPCMLTHSQRPTDHRTGSMCPQATRPQVTHPQLPGLPLTPQPRPGLLGAQGKSSSCECVGRKHSAGKNRREGRGQKGAEAGTEDEKEKEGGQRQKEDPAAWGGGVSLEPARSPAPPLPRRSV